MKRKEILALVSPRLAMELAALVIVGLCLAASVAPAQFEACGDTLALYSPASLAVRLQRAPVPGNVLTWPRPVAGTTSCFQLVAPPDIAMEYAPEVHGQYLDRFDRLIRFSSITTGLVGDTTLDQVTVNMESNHPNAAVPPLPGSFNLSNRGGVFLAQVGAGTAEQRNVGIPPHLPQTNVTTMASWSGAGSSRIYAAVSGLPLVRSDDGAMTWFEPNGGVVDPIGFPATSLAVCPTDPDILLLGTEKKGLFRSIDGGITFERADRSLTQNDLAVTALGYLTVEVGGTMVDRVYLGLQGVGFFHSENNGDSWVRISGLQVPPIINNRIDPTLEPSPTSEVRVLSLAVSPNVPTRIYAGLRTWGVYRSDDAGVTWTRANENLVIAPGAEYINGRGANVRTLRVLREQGAGGADRLLVTTQFTGLYSSSDSGNSWLLVGAGLPVNSSSGASVEFKGMLEDLQTDNTVYGATERDGLWVSTNSGGIWNPWVGGNQIFTGNLASLLWHPDGGGELLVGSWGAGVYAPGDRIDLTRIINRNELPSDFQDADLDLGLEISFSEGQVDSSDAFLLRGQNIQGYAVWRATESDPVSQEPEWQLIGLYDLTNPEFCFEDPCDALNPQHITGCFADKRANCFSFPAGVDSIRFFDREVYNGFTYIYAVSVFDYGFTGDVAPLIFDGEMLFSPRSAVESGEQATPFVDLADENYNRVDFQVNVSVQETLDNVYVVPNPLRGQAGWDVGEEATVRFVNVSLNSKCEIFTLAGDLVRTLRNVVTDGIQRGNIQWDTKNESGEDVASGVYIYRITDDQGGEYISRLTIIR